MGDVSSASNDSIFPLHHFFVDRIYEKWLHKFNKNASLLSTYNSPIGHNKDDVIVPLYPVYTHQRMFQKSFEFGYAVMTTTMSTRMVSTHEGST